MAIPRDTVPGEIILMRRWLADVFSHAGENLPWPQQAALRMIEQALAMGMFGGLLGSAYLIQEYRDRARNPDRTPDLTNIIRALQSAALGPLPTAMAEAFDVLLRTFPPGAAKMDEWLGFSRSNQGR